MWCTNAVRCPVQWAGDEERTMPDAWRCLDRAEDHGWPRAHPQGTTRAASRAASDARSLAPFVGFASEDMSAPRVLGHKVGGLAALAGAIEQIINPPHAGNVVPFAVAAK